MNNDLFDNYYNEGKYLEAYLVIKNYFNKDLSNVNIFEKFFALGIKLASFDIDFTERKNYLNEVSNALSLFSDNAELDKDIIAYINDCAKRLASVYHQIINEEYDSKELQSSQIREQNNKCIERLGEILNELKKVKNQVEFDKILDETSTVEVKLNKGYFTEAQEQSYQILSKHFSNIISKKMEELNNLELVDTNKKAVAVYKSVFEKYLDQKGKYKNNEANLKSLVYNTLFAFDSRDLFNETLVYYNHIYSMIFNEVNDEMKYKLTEWSIEVSKNK